MFKGTRFFPRTSPLAVSQLDFAGRPLGQGRKHVSKSARDR